MRVYSSMAGITPDAKIFSYLVHRKYIFQKTSSVMVRVYFLILYYGKPLRISIPKKNLGELRYYKYPHQK